MIIANKGQAIASTDYWDSAHATAGKFFLSWNAGAARLLIPDSQKLVLGEMRGAKYVIISRGPWREHGGRDALELLFEDGSDSPFCVHLVAEQCDRLIPDTQQGGGFVVTAWTRGGEKLRLPGKYRVVRNIPCLDEWTEH
jgi:hypothetical protein